MGTGVERPWIGKTLRWLVQVEQTQRIGHNVCIARAAQNPEDKLEYKTIKGDKHARKKMLRLSKSFRTERSGCGSQLACCPRDRGHESRPWPGGLCRNRSRRHPPVGDLCRMRKEIRSGWLKTNSERIAEQNAWGCIKNPIRSDSYLPTAFRNYEKSNFSCKLLPNII